METLQKELNRKFYEKMVANLYYHEFEGCGKSVIRASNFTEASAKAVTKDRDYELIGVHKLDWKTDYLSDLYEAVGLIQLLITSEDGTDLYSTIHRDNSGDYQFGLDQLSEDYIRQLNSMRALIAKLESIKEGWELRWEAIQLFQDEEKKRMKDSQAA